jgi:hypothetical protein
VAEFNSERDIPGAGSMGELIELHFQEGFTGDDVDIYVEGKPVAHFAARTRLQTGLAHIETLDVPVGATVEIAIPARGCRNRISITKETSHVTINLEDQQLRIQSSKETPGYL